MCLPVPRPNTFPPMAERPTRFEHFRWLGDKRNQIVHDVDACTDQSVIDDIVAAEVGLVFGPDTSVEARNRGYRVCTACCADSPGDGDAA